MKKASILFLLVAGLGYITLSSNAGGESANKTGSDGGAGGCGGTGCHNASATPGIAISILLDSAGTMVNTYRPGMSYRIIVTGVNASVDTLPKYGYQLSAISGTAGASGTQAGTFTDLPSMSAVSTVGVFSLLGSTASIGSTGTGTTGAMDTFSVGWTAPAAGSGTVTMYAVLCAANGNATAGNEDKWNKVSNAFTEMSTVGMNNIVSTIAINVFPNPVLNDLHVQVNNAEGTYSICLYDMNGRLMEHQVVDTQNLQCSVLPMAQYPMGIYQLIVSKNGAYTSLSVVKQ